MPLRDELLGGDLRPLCLGWLAGVTAGEVGDNAVEPEVPPGMSQLSAAQQALMEFLEIDPDLVSAAAAGSHEVEDYWHDDDSVDVWVAELRRNEIETVFNLLLQGASQQAERWAKSEYLAWVKESGSRESSPAKPRKVADLRACQGSGKVSPETRRERASPAGSRTPQATRGLSPDAGRRFRSALERDTPTCGTRHGIRL